MADMIKIQTGPGRYAWINRPPEQCGNGHPFTPGDISTYGQGWVGCWCSGAREHDDRGHHVFTCKVCGDVVLLPPCTDPSEMVGWGASHA